MDPKFSRRAILAGFASTATVTTLAPAHAFAALDDEPFSFLSASEARLLSALCDTLIPRDDFPSASEAGVVDFIDLQLAGLYGHGDGLFMLGPFAVGTPEQGYQLPLVPAQLIRQGLSALADQQSAFDLLDLPRKEAVLTELSNGEIDLGEIPSKTFFDELWKLTNQGYFADPIYGGNDAYAGWKMVGFPGAHAYYLSFVDKHNVSYAQPPMGINHQPGGDGSMPAPRTPKQER
jgi:gluconate 2-dehydrogenase alpha chain/gluconate 2-dehydrogenase gamma chain